MARRAFRSRRPNTSGNTFVNMSKNEEEIFEEIPEKIKNEVPSLNEPINTKEAHKEEVPTENEVSKEMSSSDDFENEVPVVEEPDKSQSLPILKKLSNIELPKFNAYATEFTDLFFILLILLVLITQEEIDIVLVSLLIIIALDIF